MTDTAATPEDIKRVEAELLAKRRAQEEEERARAAKLLAEAEAKGKDAALREFQAEQERKRQQEELEAVRRRAEALEETLKKQTEEMAKKFQAELEAIKSERKGIARNESPFTQPSSPAEPDILSRLNDENVQTAINRRSAEAAAKAWGLPVSPWLDK